MKKILALIFFSLLSQNDFAGLIGPRIRCHSLGMKTEGVKYTGMYNFYVGENYSFVTWIFGSSCFFRLKRATVAQNGDTIFKSTADCSVKLPCRAGTFEFYA